MIYIHRLTIQSHGATPYEFPLPIPLADFPCQFPFSLSPCHLLGPPWSQVACKLTSSSPFQFPAPHGFPKSVVRPSKTSSRHWLHIVRNISKVNTNFLILASKSGPHLDEIHEKKNWGHEILLYCHFQGVKEEVMSSNFIKPPSCTISKPISVIKERRYIL
jgi:hypothetical protein